MFDPGALAEYDLPDVAQPEPQVSTRILGKTMRDAVRNTERWKGRRTPAQDPSTGLAAQSRILGMRAASSLLPDPLRYSQSIKPGAVV